MTKRTSKRLANRANKRAYKLEDRLLKSRLLNQVQEGLKETTMSMDELSRTSRVSRTTIYRIKSCDGQSKARLHTLNLLLKTLNGQQRYDPDVDEPKRETRNESKPDKEMELFIQWLSCLSTVPIKTLSRHDYHAFRELAKRYFKKSVNN